jgi:hypothetical protein
MHEIDPKTEENLNLILNIFQVKILPIHLIKEITKLAILLKAAYSPCRC